MDLMKFVIKLDKRKMFVKNDEKYRNRLLTEHRIKPWSFIFV